MWQWIVCDGRAATICLMLIAGSASAQDDSRDDKAEQAIVDRFQTVLEKNPRRGTAFDKVYGFHLERGSLDDLLKFYRQVAQDKPQVDSASAWMIIGLIESQRGQEGPACEAFRAAESRELSNPLAPYYLGLSLARLGDTEKGSDAFERAIARVPSQSDLLEILQALGRLYQRSQQSDKALEIWNRIEQQYPNDLRVREQVATLLQEEGDLEHALTRFENIARLTQDRYRQSMIQVEIADIKLKLRRAEDALRDFESLLSKLNPDHWLHKEVRRRIETVFLDQDDRAGLIGYYEKWLTAHPEDLDAVSRVAVALVVMGRGSEARSWLEKGLRLAPSKKDLRWALINQLQFEDKYAEALIQYEQMDKYDPNNPDTLRNWGRAAMKDSSHDVADRQQKSRQIWRRLLAMRPEDAVAVSQIAELFRQSAMAEDALELYRRSIELAPNSIQYREYLGEYLHTLRRNDEAVAVWTEMATGPRKTASNTARLAEVFAMFGYPDQALEMNAEACLLDPKDFNLQLKRVDLLARAERHDEALIQLAVVEKLVENDAEREAWIHREIAELKITRKLGARTADVQKELMAPTERSSAPSEVATAKQNETGQAKRWYWLARAAEADSQQHLAATAIARALKLDPQSIPILTTSARIHEARQDLLAAVDALRRLATIDRRFRTESLKQVVTLERRLGRREAALQAAQELFASAPGNSEICEFYSQVCLQLGRPEEGIMALRRSLRANPGDVATLTMLALILAERDQRPEAMELLWRAFERSKSLDDRLGVIQKLTNLHQKSGQFERLFARLERERRDPAQHRDITFCLAQSYETKGDLAAAQRTLETLLSDETRDLPLLTKLRNLAQQRYQLPMAIRYQRQIWRITNDQSERYRLSQLIVQAGGTEDADDLLPSLSDSAGVTGEVLSFLDTLYQHGRTGALLARLQLLRERHPENWELMYREGVVLAGSKPDEAIRHFEAILSTRHPDDESSVVTNATGLQMNNMSSTRLRLVELMSQTDRIRSAMQFVPTPGPIPAPMAVPGQPTIRSAPPMSALEKLDLERKVLEVNASLQLAERQRQQMLLAIQQRQQQYQRMFWMPSDYGTARLAAWGWLLNLTSNKRGRMEEFVETRLKELKQSPSRETLIDRIAIHSFLFDLREKFAAARQLARLSEDDLDAQVYYLTLMGRRSTTGFQGIRLDRITLGNEDPLGVEDLADALRMYERVRSHSELIPWNIKLLTGLDYEFKKAELQPDVRRLRTGKVTGQVFEAQRVNQRKANPLIRTAINNVSTPLEVACLFEDGLVQDSQSAAKLLGNLVEFHQQPAMAPATPIAAAVTSQLYSPEWLAQQLSQSFESEEKHPDLYSAWKLYVKLHSLALNDSSNSSQASNPQASYMTAAQLMNRNSMALREAKENGLAERQFLHQAGGFCLSAMHLLSSLYFSHLNSRDADELVAAFEQNVSSTEITDNERLLWEHSLAWLKFRLGNEEAALEILAKVVTRYPDRADMRLTLAAQYEVATQPDKGLAVLDTVPATVSELQLERELMALRLAMASAQKDRAKIAAQRLFGLQLPGHELLPVASKMLQLDLLTEASVLLERVPATDRDLIYAKTLMELRLARGEKDRASEDAEKILGQLDSVNMIRVNSTQGQLFAGGRIRVVEIPQATEQEIRDFALSVLKATGRLPGLIEKLEAELIQTPDSEQKIKSLIAYHKFAGHRERVEELTRRQLEIHDDRPPTRYARAIAQLSGGQIDEAVEQMTLLAQRHPGYFASRCGEAISRFQGRNCITRLTQIVEQVDWSTIDRTLESLPEVIDELMERPATQDVGKRLFLKEWQARPGRRAEFLLKLSNDQLWDLPEITESLRRLPFPSQNSPSAGDWDLFGRERKIDVNGRPPKAATSMVRFLESMATSGQLDVLAKDVEEGLKQRPDWTAGKVLLALIDLSRDRIEQGRDAMIALLPNLKVELQGKSKIVWELAGQLSRNEKSLDVALVYYELTVSTDGMINTRHFKTLVRSLVSQGRREDARKLLLAALPQPVQLDSGSEEKLSSLDVQRVLLIGAELRAIQFPVDAIDVYLKARDRAELVNGGGPDLFVELKRNLSTAMSELTSEEFVQSFESRRRGPDFDIHVSVFSLPGNTTLQSRWSSCLAALATDAERTNRTHRAVVQIREQNPDHIGGMILSALLAFATKDDLRIKSSCTELAESATKQKSADPAENQPGAAPSNNVSSSSLNRVALWLVARQCLKDPSLATVGTRLGNEALAATLHHDRLRGTLLTEWIQIAEQGGDRATVERLQKEFSQ